MNKFDAINKVLISDLQAQDKCLLIELIMRSDDEGFSWPSVERLCKARGIKHEKNFKGADAYLPGIVTKAKKGRKNTYTLNPAAIDALAAKDVTLKHTPALVDTPAAPGVNTPAAPDNTPARPENTPAVEGANSSKNNTKDSSEESSRAVADAPALPDIESASDISLALDNSGVFLEDSSTEDAPAQAGVWDDEIEWDTVWDEPEKSQFETVPNDNIADGW
jgi:hypothetical protein